MPESYWPLAWLSPPPPYTHVQAMAARGASHGAARLCLPAVLQLLGSHPDGACPAFADAWRRLPLRAFLPWAPQMLAVLGDAQGPALAPVLEQLAARCVLCVLCCAGRQTGGCWSSSPLAPPHIGYCCRAAAMDAGGETAKRGERLQC